TDVVIMAALAESNGRRRYDGLFALDRLTRVCGAIALARNSPSGSNTDPNRPPERDAVHTRSSEMSMIRDLATRTRFALPGFARVACALALAAMVGTACDKLGGKEPRRSESGGEIDESFEPTKIKSVKGVPVADV